MADKSPTDQPFRVLTPGSSMDMTPPDRSAMHAVVQVVTMIIRLIFMRLLK